MGLSTEIKQKLFTFRVKYFNEENIVQTYTGEYRNLMVLLNEKFYLEDFGECKGMGRCGTCVVRVTGLKGAAICKERNEAATLGKMNIQETELRLSCHILINEDIENVIVEIAFC
ncbi:MAG: 2Fe-2S iron-sulfur cluster-binding protein [Flavisolibacter sp.]|jgi:2Fe-2S ferredoxin